jgi:dihydroorotase
MRHDLLIQGGTVIDPAQNLMAVRDVAVSDGKIAAVEPSLDSAQANEILDATGLLVTPGLIDLHIHAYWGVSHYGILPDPANVARGVTTALDVGSAGARTFPAFRRFILERSRTRLYALLNISNLGMIAPQVGELVDLRYADVFDAVEMARANRDCILGIKCRLSENVAVDHDVAALERAIEAAETLGCFVMAHVGNSHTPMDELAALLRPGDVVTHTYHPFRHGVLDAGSRVIDGIRTAQQRGVIFDVGHGVASFSFRVAEQALAQDLRPSTLSSDLHFYNIEGPVYDLLNVLSKFMHLGLTLPDVIGLSTAAPARVMGLGDRLGTLRVGAEADVALLRLDEGQFTLTDSTGVSVTAHRKLTHIRTVSRGRVYRPWLD